MSPSAPQKRPQARNKIHKGPVGAAPRAAAAWALQQVLQHSRSLTQALPEAQQKAKLSVADAGLAQAIAYGVLRELPTLEWLVNQLLDKPLKAKVRIVHYLILAGLYQLREMRIAPHGAISATVDATTLVRQSPLKGLVNAVLRSYQRRADEFAPQLEAALTHHHNHPSWLRKRLLQDYPEQASAIMGANQQQPPMWLRVNARHHSVQSYQALLTEQGIASQAYPWLAQGLCLAAPCDVTKLPGFADGWVSVQDAAAQFAAPLLAVLGVQPGQRVLDACAAPGGKTAHIAETLDVQLTALDIEPQRLIRVEENVARLGLAGPQLSILSGNASTADWWDGKLFDHILLDAPCSATGVIRRHPDIKWLRRDSDIAELTDLQRTILDNLWAMLKPGGTLLYATCSVLPEENTLQIVDFLKQQADAKARPLPAPPDWLTRRPFKSALGDCEWQLFAQAGGHDGFYYAGLQKTG